MFKTFAIALVATVAAATLGVQAQAADITGAGATFPKPVYDKWAELYKGATKNAVNYQGIGSGGGIKQIEAKTVDFGASDKPLKPADLQSNGLMQFPTVVGGVVPVMNLPGVNPGSVKLSGEVLVRLHRTILGRQVSYVAVAGQHAVVGAQVLVDGLGLGRAFDDDDVHKVRMLGWGTGRPRRRRKWGPPPALSTGGIADGVEHGVSDDGLAGGARRRVGRPARADRTFRMGSSGCHTGFTSAASSAASGCHKAGGQPS